MNKKLSTFTLVFIMYGLTYGQEIGLQLYSLRNQMDKDVPGAFKKIQSWGIKNLEDGNGGTYDYTLQEYKKLLADHDLKMVGVSAAFEELEATPETVIKRAKAYGAKFATCFWIPHNDTIFTIKETRKALDVFNKTGKKLKEEGITLTYHPHGYEFRPYEDELLMDYMIKHADNFDFEMDVYWFAHPGEDPLEWLRKYPDKFKLMHLKDCKKGVPGNQNGTADVETNVVLGMGQIDMKAIVAEARKMNIDYLFIEDESSRVVEQVPKSLAYLKSLEE